MLSRTTLLAAAMLAAAPALANAPRIRAEERVFAYDAQVAACDAPGVLDEIRARFDAREAEFWSSGLTLLTIDRIRQTHFRPNGADLIPRRYCRARALASDGRWRPLYYYLVEDGGFSGWHGSKLWGLIRFPTPASYNVEWCLDGLDRHRTYAQNCRMARP